MILPPRRWPEAARTLARTFGVRGLVQRTRYEARRVLGAFSARPRQPVTQAPPSRAHPFTANATRLAAATDRTAAIERAERVLAGEYEAYRWHWRPLPDNADTWLAHFAPSEPGRPLAPWWKVRTYAPNGRDIKDVWEPARFAWSYDLVRAWLLTRDDRFARAFHERLASWWASSPPFRGPHWACGQEVAIRATALLYAEANLAGAPSSDVRAMARIVEVLAASGERITNGTALALSQRNNHAISEAVGLLLLGIRLRGTHREAARWARRGREMLERLIREQFAEDGWYIQHSFNYLRLALDQCVTAQRMLRSAGTSLSAGAIERLRAATRLLLAVIDPSTGVVPNHGHNDGAFVHPITLGAHRDYRPSITAACAVFGVPMPGNVAADPEVPAWLATPDPVSGAPISDGVRTGPSGWAAARVGEAFVFLRAGRYVSRPAHIDPLHVCVRMGGREIVVDAGTFSYNASPPWRNGLAGARVHNGPIVDDREPGVKGPRFLWLLWPEATITRAEHDARGATLAAEIPGVVRRVVHVTPSRVIIEDDAIPPNADRLSTTWLLHPEADPAMLVTSGERRVHEAVEGDVRGWFSPRYGERIASRWVENAGSAREPLRCTVTLDESTSEGQNPEP